jgi:metal-responsive CopG/Arc/MetJ family transcriptional regulator
MNDIWRERPMSDAKHTGEKQVPFFLEEDLLTRWDNALKKLGYKNRAERFREVVRNDIEKASQK